MINWYKNSFIGKLAPWLQIIFWLLVVGILFAIYFSIKRAINRSKLNVAFKDDFKNLTSQGQKPTYPQTSYMQMADKIYEAGCPAGIFFILPYSLPCSGTDEEAIMDTFNAMQSELDVLLLVKAFGHREPRGTIWMDEVDLGGFLATELDGEDIQEINKKLASRGIKYNF